MDGGENREIAVNCLWHKQVTAGWCPDNELADAHSWACKYSEMAEVMVQLGAERVVLLDEVDDIEELVGHVKDVKMRWNSVSNTSCSNATLGS